MAVPKTVAVALMGVLVASFAGTTLDTACRLQRYVIQELASTFAPRVSATACAACGYDLSFNQSDACPECGAPIPPPLEGRGQGDGVEPASNPTASEQTDAHTHPPAPSLRGRGSWFNPLVWLTNKHGATIFAVVLAAAIAALPAPGSAWTVQTAGTGGLILWPLFGATNQLLGGLAFLVITFWLWRRKLPVWFVVFPMLFMLVMPALAMGMQLPTWLGSENPNWAVIFIAIATLALEAWMITEAVLLWPKARGELEAALPAMAPAGTAPRGGRSC